MYEEKINAYFDAPERRAELVEAISRLVRIRSVREEPLPGMPFGPGPAAALAEGLKLAEELGFATRNYDNYVGTADLNDKETALHILCHLDVVGEGTGWTVTEPYVPKEVDGMLYGRGTDDDKGPVAAVLLAMKAVKELGVPLRRNARLLMGTDEESGSSDIAYYYAREPYAPYAFSPDAEFPLINIEKGSYKPVFTKSWPAETATPRVTILADTATAGTVGAGGLGDIAVRYGHQRGITSVMWVTVVFLIILVQVVQLIFNWLSRRIDKRLDQPSGAKKSGPLDLLARFAHTK